MASYSTCPYCGSLVRSDQKKCPGCNAPNEQFVVERSSPDLQPGTIQELKDYCSAHRVPLLQLRFFIGEDYREPRAFGVYRDRDQFVVYRNKSDGSRSIGYQGPDEERAVSMIFRKLLETGGKQGLISSEEGIWKTPLPADGPPRTIEELQAFCLKHNMPLRKMRFFIGEDTREARAFGIYRDGEEVVVYKNKDNGERAVRYRGRFEERGVKELYDKLLEECHRRGIYPEGKPVTHAGSAGGARSSGARSGGASRPVRKSRIGCLYTLIEHPFRIFLILILLGVIVTSCSNSISHRRDGYFQIPGDDLVYYHYGDDWYYTLNENDSGYWYETDSFPEENYQEYGLGDEWDVDWGVSDFQESSTWDDLHSSSGYDYDYDSDYDSWDSGDTDWGGSDYDSWDSGDTDWDSDW